MTAVTHLALALGLLGTLGPAVQAQDADPELPGYYRFYKRVGDQAELDAEREFAEARAAGEYAAQHPDLPLAGLALPDAKGLNVSLRRNIGKRNTLLVTFRSWW